MNIVIDAAGKVLMASPDGCPIPPDGCTLITLNGEQAEAMAAAAALPNVGLMFGADGGFTPIAPPAAPASTTVAERLAQIGLTVDDLKAALGGQP